MSPMRLSKSWVMVGWKRSLVRVRGKLGGRRSQTSRRRRRAVCDKCWDGLGKRTSVPSEF